LLGTSIARAEPAPPPEPKDSPVTINNRQLLVVRTAHWYASKATLDRYERDAKGHWAVVGEQFAAMIGRHGMAWGRGLQEAPEKGLLKREGDGKSPAGVFALTRAFGVEDALPSGSHAFPYLHATTTTYCVEDQRSGSYNQLIDSRTVTPRAWEKWSELRRPDGLFDWAIVVRQNEPEPRPGYGSCVFLHIWRGAGMPTAGCTAMPRDRVEALVKWLDPDAKPLLVQLPVKEYAARREAWDLP
jgi:L,D-peptidoglycan transpeptidase YkuD (ErfK/YbiS/YcfS/YnhG family)